MYIPKYLQLYELIPYSLYQDEPHHKLWGLFDDRVLITADALREKYGPITVNNWYTGGHNQYCGYRPLNCGVGAKWSQHKFGRALDCHFRPDVDIDGMRKYIIASKSKNDPVSRYITCLEMNVSWLHFDVRYHTSPDPILLVYP